MPRKLLIHKIKDIFHIAHREPIFTRMMDSHILVRYSIGFILILFGIIGMITPIPAGFIFVIVGLSLLIGLVRTKYLVIRSVHFTRIHILYGKFYMWLKSRK